MRYDGYVDEQMFDASCTYLERSILLYTHLTVEMIDYLSVSSIWTKGPAIDSCPTHR
jgi:hypothetical protein